ncbi:hypothetical protein ACF073_40765 [Streptomyces sp. NPDC015171]|uniref:hypothetical protein n=1 Tax=Streptomyces sp. NPDC015171 TaxID=3364945 RepID=UPI003702965C
MAPDQQTGRAIMRCPEKRKKKTLECAQRFEIGKRRATGHYPITVDGQPAGFVYRRHGMWWADMPGMTNHVRRTDRDSAIAELVRIFDLGHKPSAYDLPTPTPIDSVTLHIPELRFTLPNLVRAAEAMARLDELGWQPLQGYPGADNPWHMRCRLCGWKGRRFWSKLRGRNGDGIPRPANRHPGCIPTGLHAAEVHRLQSQQTATCTCPDRHPVSLDECRQALSEIRAAGYSRHYITAKTRVILERCSASRIRAMSLREALEQMVTDGEQVNRLLRG